jgi:hypothetical protein
MLGGLVFWWLLKRARNTSTIEQSHYLVFLLLLGIHALLELPLQYAYFLLPFGLIAGSLDVGKERTPATRIHDRILAFALVSVAATVLYMTVVDYLKIETRNYGLRFEVNGIPTSIPRTPPEVRVLDQFNEFFVLVRNQPSSGVAQAEINRMRDSVNVAPSALTMYNLAANLALNGSPQESRHWLITLCKTMPESHCQEARRKWQQDEYIDRAGVPWPVFEGANPK